MVWPNSASLSMAVIVRKGASGVEASNLLVAGRRIPLGASRAHAELRSIRNRRQGGVAVAHALARGQRRRPAIHRLFGNIVDASHNLRNRHGDLWYTTLHRSRFGQTLTFTACKHTSKYMDTYPAPRQKPPPRKYPTTQISLASWTTRRFRYVR